MGWSMNDLRSRNRTLAPVPPLGPRTGEIVSAPPKSRTKGNSMFRDSRPGTEPKRSDSTPGGEGSDDEADPTTSGLSFPVSRDVHSMPVTATSDEADQAEADQLSLSADGFDGAGDPTSGPTTEAANQGGSASGRRAKAKKNKAPASRPAKRRETRDPDEAEDDKFPWHHQFDDDEPEELQAKSPLLSRAFRSSVG